MQEENTNNLKKNSKDEWGGDYSAVAVWCNISTNGPKCTWLKRQCQAAKT